MSWPIDNKVKLLAYLVSHPTQYQAPFLRRIAPEGDIDLTVMFGSDFSVRGYRDRGFGVPVKWDVPLLVGYKHEFLPVIRDDARPGVTHPLNYGISSHLRGEGPGAEGDGAFNVLWVHEYSTVNAVHATFAAKALGIPVLLQAESSLREEEKNASLLSKKRLYFLMLKYLVSRVLPIGSRNAAFWQHYLGEDVPRFPMPYAVDNNWFEQHSQEDKAHRVELLSESKLDAERRVILFAGKLLNRKRCGELLEAYRRLSVGTRTTRHPYLGIVGDGASLSGSKGRGKRAYGWKVLRFSQLIGTTGILALATLFIRPSEHGPWG